jgi:hypothetical protein
MGKECSMCRSEGNLEQNFDWESIQKDCVNVGG